jgi:hypothetical protein
MRASHHGEGGILTLLALVSSRWAKRNLRRSSAAPASGERARPPPVKSPFGRATGGPRAELPAARGDARLIRVQRLRREMGTVRLAATYCH